MQNGLSRLLFSVSYGMMKGGGDGMETIIRPLHRGEYPVLEVFLYHAIYIPEGAAPPPRSIIQLPELQVYLADFGKKDDHAFAAESGGLIVGAVWVRIMEDYGHIDAETPSFAVSLLPSCRGRGIGTAMMRHMLRHLQKAGYRSASLAVQKENYAVRMYRALGFRTVRETDEEFIMAIDLTSLSDLCF